MMIGKSKMKSIGKIIYCSGIAFLFVTLCSRCSFLYDFNDWVDVNYFFTVGKSMMNGMVLYRDIYEQKGPLVYFIYGVAYLFSNKTFYAVYVIEVLSGAIFLFYSFKCVLLYCETMQVEDHFVWMSLPIYAGLVYSSISFYNGGSVEELVMPMQAVGLYWLLLYIKTEYISIKKIFFAGVMAGCIFGMKFTLLGQFFLWMALIFLLEVFRKKYKIAFKYCVIFLSGMFLATIPWIMYFGYNHAIDDCIRVYFYNNLFLYSNASRGILETIIGLMIIFLQQMRGNLQFSFFIFVGIICLFFGKKMKGIEKIIVPLCFFCSFFFIYVGGRIYAYYAFPLSLYSVFGMLLPAWMLQFAYKMIKNIRNLKKLFIMAGSILICLFMLIYADIRSVNTNMIKAKKEDLVVFRFNNIIQEENKNPILLEYGCQDIGMYTVTGTLPVCRYFCSYNIPLDDFKEEQDYFVNNRLVDYVICLDWYDEIILQNYKLICEDSQYDFMDKKEHIYYLFKKK